MKPMFDLLEGRATPSAFAIAPVAIGPPPPLRPYFPPVILVGPPSHTPPKPPPFVFVPASPSVGH